MSRLPRFPDNTPAVGKDLNLILAILDSGNTGVTSATLSGLVGDSLSPTTPSLSGSIDPTPGGAGSPSQVRGLTASSGIDNFSQSHTAYVILSWTPNPVSDFVSRYDIYYHKGSDTTLYNLSVGGDVNTLRVNNLFPGTVYSFSIQAHDAANRASVWTPEISLTISLDAEAPAIPTGLTALGAPKGAALYWNEVGAEGISNDLKQYQIQASLDSNFGTTMIADERSLVVVASGISNPNPWLITVGPGSYLFYFHQNSGVTLNFRIRSMDWTGNASDWSSGVSTITS